MTFMIQVLKPYRYPALVVSALGLYAYTSNTTNAHYPHICEWMFACVPLMLGAAYFQYLIDKQEVEEQIRRVENDRVLGHDYYSSANIRDRRVHQFGSRIRRPKPNPQCNKPKRVSSAIK